MSKHGEPPTADSEEFPSAARMLLGAVALFASLGAGIYLAAEEVGSDPSFFETIGGLLTAWIGLLVGIGLYGIIVFGRPGGDA